MQNNAVAMLVPAMVVIMLAAMLVATLTLKRWLLGRC